MKILAFDTCLTACSVAVLADDRVLASRAEPMARGHQERLAPMAQAVMAGAGLDFGRLERIGATVGPAAAFGDDIDPLDRANRDQVGIYRCLVDAGG